MAGRAKPKDEEKPPDPPPPLADVNGTLLGEHEGREVVGILAALSGQNDALKDAMEASPVVQTNGDYVGIYFRCRVTDVHFPDVKDAEEKVNRKQDYLAVGAYLILDPESERALLTALQDQGAKLQRIREEKVGVAQFPGIEGEPDPAE
jgi:hypothetical protein